MKRKRRRHYSYSLERTGKVYRRINWQRRIDKAIKQRRGRIDARPYKPWVAVTEGSRGFVHRLIDPVTGEIIHCLSNGEVDWTRQLLWLEGHMALYSQVFIPREVSLRAATELGLWHMRCPDRKTIAPFSTDLLHLRCIDGKVTWTAFSVKSRPNKSKRVTNRLAIEVRSWELLGVTCHVVYRDEVSPARIQNVRWIECYRGDSDLVAGRDQWRRIEAALYPRIAGGMPVNTACHATDAELGLEEGTSLSQVRFYLHNRIWEVDLDVLINTCKPLTITKRHLKK